MASWDASVAALAAAQSLPDAHEHLSELVLAIEQPGTIHHVGGWRAAVDSGTRAVPSTFAADPSIAPALDALSAAAQRAQATQFRGGEGRPGLSPSGRPAGPPSPLTGIRSSTSAASPRSSGVGAGTGAGAGGAAGPASAGPGEDTAAAPPPPVMPLQPNVPPHLRKVPVESLNRPPLGPTTAAGLLQQFQNPAAAPLGSYSTYTSKRSGPQVSVREIPKNVQAPSSLPKSAFLPVGSLVTWLLGLLNAGLYRGQPRKLTRSIALAFLTCLAVNIWLLICSVAFDNANAQCKYKLRAWCAASGGLGLIGDSITTFVASLMILQASSSGTVMVLLRIGQVASIGSFLLNLIGAIMVFQLNPYHTTCSKSLWVTVFAVVIGWLVSIVVMPAVYWRSKFDMVLAEPVAPPPPPASRIV